MLIGVMIIIWYYINQSKTTKKTLKILYPFRMNSEINSLPFESQDEIDEKNWSKKMEERFKERKFRLDDRCKKYGKNIVANRRSTRKKIGFNYDNKFYVCLIAKVS